jgi:putative protease
MASGSLHIVAPVSTLAEAEALIAAGADELYCGALLDDWCEVFGDTDVLTRRQGRSAHVRSRAELAAIAGLGVSSGCPVALTLTARYSSLQEAWVLDMAREWEAMGGQMVMVADPALVVTLRQCAPALDLHLSLLAGVFNAASARFFASLGVTRIVLPRDLSIDEMAAIAAGAPGIGYEALVMYQRCRFIDGMCGFYHGVRVPAGVTAEFGYEMTPDSALGVAWSADPAYEGHGCELAWIADGVPVRPLDRDDLSAPHCAACLVAELERAGVRHLKVAGRGFPTEQLTRAVRFLRDAIDIHQGALSGGEGCAAIREAYARTFGRPCDPTRCYYAGGP